MNNQEPLGGSIFEFKDKALLELALTHSSFSNENNLRQNNQRLEFLGDAVLELLVSEHLFNIRPQMSEGDMTRMRASIVREGSLCDMAKNIGLGERILLGNGEETSGGRERGSILSDAFEALIGAVFVERGLEGTREIIAPLVEGAIKASPKSPDYKTHLQELYQEKYKNTVSYNIVSEEGPDHDKLFISQALHGGKVIGLGRGKTKKDAEQQAALEALRKYSKAYG